MRWLCKAIAIGRELADHGRASGLSMAMSLGALIRPSGRGMRWMLLIPALAALAIAYTFWVNVYPPQPGAYRVLPWIVLAWCCAPVLATLLSPRLVDLITSGVLAANSRTDGGLQNRSFTS